MDEATIAQTIETALIFAIFLGFLIWGIRSGQFKNIEEAKYSMFPDDASETKNPTDRLKEGDKKK